LYGRLVRPTRLPYNVCVAQSFALRKSMNKCPCGSDYTLGVDGMAACPACDGPTVPSAMSADRYERILMEMIRREKEKKADERS
jgi:hypothetical protein